MGNVTPTLHTITLRRVLLVAVGWLVFAAPAQAGTLPGPETLASAATTSAATTVAATVATAQTAVTAAPQDAQSVLTALPEPVRTPAQAVVAAVPAPVQTVVHAAAPSVIAAPAEAAAAVVRQAAGTVKTSPARHSHSSQATRHAKRLHVRAAATGTINVTVRQAVARPQHQSQPRTMARAIPSRSPAGDLFGASSTVVFSAGAAHVAAALPPTSHPIPLERARRAAHPVDGAPRPAALPLQLERPG